MNHLDIVRRLCDNGYEAFVVGGAVRDLLNGCEPKDFDVVTNAKPAEIRGIFRDRNIKITGESFKVTFVDDIEVATYRKDRYSELLDAKKCRVEYAETLSEDLERRDLTINAIAMCEYTGHIVDEHNGKEDLEKRIIRFVGDPVMRIKEDPNRIIRACRFLAKLEGEFDKETFEALQECAHFVKTNVKPDRIHKEILKAMEVDTPSLFFSALHLIGALKFILPEMDRCFNHQHGRYHIESVGEHILAAGDNISPRFPLLRLAGFLHDIGKPDAFNPEDGSFIGHEFIGARLAESRLKKLRFSTAEVNKVRGLVRSHMYTCANASPRARRRLVSRLAEKNVDRRDFLRLKLADRKANMTKGDNMIGPIRQLLIGAGIRGVEEPPMTVKSLALSGGEIIETLDMPPGPNVGKLQRVLLELVLEFGQEYNTKPVLKEYAKYNLQFLDKLP